MFDKAYPPISDTVTRDQFFDNFKRKRPLEPERELMLAVLADAVECYWKYSGAHDGVGTRLFQDAREWLLEDDERRPFSFVNVCSALQLDPGYIRRGVFARKQQNAKLDEKSTSQLRMPPPRYVRRNLKDRRKRGVYLRLAEPGQRRRRSTPAIRHLLCSKTVARRTRAGAPPRSKIP